jgi:hypothetical protein
LQVLEIIHLYLNQIFNDRILSEQKQAVKKKNKNPFTTIHYIKRIK